MGQEAEARMGERQKAIVVIGVSAGKAKQARIDSLGLVSLSTCGRLWGHRGCPWLSGSWSRTTVGQGKYQLAVQELDGGDGSEHRLWIPQ